MFCSSRERSSGSRKVARLPVLAPPMTPALRPIGNDSCGPGPLPEYRIPVEPMSFTIILEPLAK